MIVLLICYFIVGSTVAASICIEEGFDHFLDPLVLPFLLMIWWPAVISEWLRFNREDWERLRRDRAAQDFRLYGC